MRIQTGVVLTVEGVHHLASLDVLGTLTHPRGETNGLNLFVDGLVNVRTGSHIDVTAKGYRGGARDGNASYRGETRGPAGIGTTENGADNSADGSFVGGGSYGSFGGSPTNPLYGSETVPTDLGSGGAALAADLGRIGGNGGGRIQIRAADIIVDGEVIANGGDSLHTRVNAIGDGGGGSGGSILLISDGTISGTGTMRAVGGISSHPLRYGGLGRIAISGYKTNSFTGTMDAATIFRQPAGTGGDLRLDSTIISIAPGETRTYGSISSSGASSSTIFNAGTIAMTDDALTIPNGLLLVQDGIIKGALRSNSVLGNLSVAYGGVITHSRGSLKGVQLDIAGVLDVQVGGKIDVTAKGYRGGARDGNGSYRGETRGPDGAATTENGANNSEDFSFVGGGSYGSFGGSPTNPLYGSETFPTDLGSGGAALIPDIRRIGGNGGGRVQIHAGDFIVNGEVLANGGDSLHLALNSVGDAGGGSGGSILLVLDGTISGNGTIGAIGGVSAHPLRYGGAGRIAISGYKANAFNGPLRGATIFLKPAGTGGDLRLNSTILNIPPNETHIIGSLSSGEGNSTIFNAGTIAMTDDALTIPNGLLLVQDGVIKGASRSDSVLGNLTVAAGGIITHTRGSLKGLQLDIAGVLDVQVGGKIDVTGKGYRGGGRDGNDLYRGETRGPDGAGTTDNGANNSEDFSLVGGGSYGSFGGSPTNPLYGAETFPTDLGSGGAALARDIRRVGGNGGGRIEIQARDIIVDGEMLANGGDSLHTALNSLGDAGGGSGGSLLLILAGGRFGGGGSVLVQGGVSNVPDRNGGCGRLAIIGQFQNAFTGSLGGSCSTTVYVFSAPLLFIEKGADAAIATWSAAPEYLLERSPSLSKPAWAPTAEQSSPARFDDSQGSAFFRLRRVPRP